MSQPSNLYAEKVFSEHPLALWPLDDSASFLSLLSSDDKKLTSWSISGGTYSSSNLSNVSKPTVSPTIQLDTASSDQLTAISPDIIAASSLDPSKKNFNISSYFYSQNSAITSVDLGYEYTDGTVTQVTENFSISGTGVWAFLSKTFEIPATVENLRVVIKVNASSVGDYTCHINGISMAQWSENQNTTTSGVSTTSLYSMTNSDIALADVQAIQAPAYGLKVNPGYYTASDNQLNAYNDGLPIVYGSSNATKIRPDISGPSVVLPGFGFLNDSGRNKNMTFEFWMRISTSSYSPVKIFGPISSDDGLYVDGQFLTLKVDSETISHFVGNWGRPMLIHIRLVQNSISLLVNGEQVSSISVDSNNLNLPLSKNNNLSSTYYGKSQDWLGIYGSSSLLYFEIESPAIYPYSVPEVVAKRRFVYGQGVEYPESNNSSFGGSSAIIDYRNSEYANNYLYPDMARWNQGIVENLSVDTNILAAPTYSSPEIILKDTTEASWLVANSSANASSTDPKAFVNLSLDGSNGGYLFFNTLNVLSQDLKALYVVFRSNDDAEQTILKIEDSVTKNYFRISISGTQILYTLSYGGEITTVVSDSQHTVGLATSAGIDIDKFSSVYGSKVATFFGSKSTLRMSVGSDVDFLNGFTGKLYRVGLSTKRNLQKISSYFNSSGTLSNIENVFNQYDGAEEIYGGDYNTTITDFLDGGDPTSFTTAQLYSHTASYTVIPREYLGSFGIDVSVDSSWQDYIPLQYFAKTVSDADGDSSYRLSYLQLNIDNPIVYSTNGESFDTKNASVRTYVSFQYMGNNPNTLSENIANVAPAPISKTISPGSEWTSTRYEFVDGTVVFPPSGVDFGKIAIVIHIEATIPGIESSQVKIKSLQIASQANELTQLTAIKTKLGTSIYPYLKSGIYNNYSGNNPVQIYKNSTPYLYLTDDGGIRLLGETSDYRGISFPINTEQSLSYRVGAIQLFTKYNALSFNQTPERILEIQAYNKSVYGYVVADNDSGSRGRLYFTDIDGQPVGGLSVYLNGSLVSSGYLIPNEWSVIGIQSAESFVFDAFTGNLNVVGNISVDSVSSYRITSDKTGVTTKFRTWAELESMLDSIGINPATWGDFLSQVPAITWENVLYIPTTKQYLIDLESIYKAYIGTNKFIVSDSSTLSFKNYAYRAYIGAEWSSRVVSPV
jgi:hypothetical protein